MRIGNRYMNLKETYDTGCHSHSQFGQDLQVIEYFKYKTFGYFVELGAGDGKDLSNTYLLEHCYGWNGLLIEPNPIHFDALIQNRPSSTCVSQLCSSEPGLTKTFVLADHLSGITDNIVKYTHILDENSYPTIILETTTLTQVLDSVGAPRIIDYLSLDTEGSELDILKGIDFNRYTFLYICVEHNDIESNRQDIRQLLESNGYAWYRENNNVDDDYIYLGT